VGADQPMNDDHQPEVDVQADLAKEKSTLTQERQDTAETTFGVPGFEILGKLGEGGMGIVYRARQIALNRVCALKVIRSGIGATTSDLLRFTREAEVVAELTHPNVVRVFDTGVHAGMPWMALEFLPGGSLRMFLRTRGKLSATRAAEILLDAARGVAAAHDAGIVHRDLKPGNILLTEDQTAKVADFGLAKRSLIDGDLTHSRAILGTPEYLAPEQGRGAKYVGPAADVYALGVLLYECVAGKVPFAIGNRSLLDFVLQINTEVTPKLSRSVEAVPRDYDWIVQKCLEKQPTDRYQDAGELVVDLEHFVAGRPLARGGVRTGERLSKWARRKPAALAFLSVAAVSIAFMILCGVLLRSWHLSELARADAEARLAMRSEGTGTPVPAIPLAGPTASVTTAKPPDAAGTAKPKPIEPELPRTDLVIARGEYAKSVRRATELADSGKKDEAALLMSETPKSLRGWEFDFLSNAKRLKPAQSHKFKGHTRPIVGMAFHPDGLRFATGGQDFSTRLWDLAKDEPIITLQEHTSTVNSLVFSRDGRRLISGGADKTTIVRDAGSGKPVSIIEDQLAAVVAVATNQDGGEVLSAAGGVIRIWDSAKNAPLHVLSGQPNATLTVAFSRDGRVIASGGWESPIRLWNRDTGKSTDGLSGHLGQIMHLEFHPDGLRLASCDNRGSIRIWDLVNKRTIYELLGHDESVTSVSISPDGKRLVTCSAKQWILWDIDGGLELMRFKSVELLPQFRFFKAEFSADGRKVLVCGVDEAYGAEGHAAVYDVDK